MTGSAKGATLTVKMEPCYADISLHSSGKDLDVHLRDGSGRTADARNCAISFPP
jgi:hypothetical protein